MEGTTSLVLLLTVTSEELDVSCQSAEGGRNVKPPVNPKYMNKWPRTEGATELQETSCLSIVGGRPTASQ